MRLISRHVDYAVNALCFLAKRDSLFASVSDLREEMNMPPFFMREIMRLLCRAGILRSMRGKGGGFELAMPTSKISVYKLMMVFNGAGADEGCTFRKRACPRTAGCKLRRNLKDIESLIRKRLEQVTIASLVEGS